jgi:hypothetical protein
VSIVKTYENIGKIGETLTLPVSARGDGLCIYLPKGICETHGILAGDKILTELSIHYRKIDPEKQKVTTQ